MDSRVRVLQVLGSSPFGGGTRHVLTISKAAQSAGLEVDILTSDPATQDFVRAAGFRIIAEPRLPSNRQWWAAPMTAWKLRRVVHQRSYALVNSHTSVVGLLVRVGLFRPFPKRRPYKVVHTVHGIAFGGPDRPLGRAFVGAERLLARLTDALITVNSSDAHLLRTRWNSHLKITYIPNGVPIPDPAELRSSTRERQNGLRIGFVGRLAYQKGVDVLLGALKKLSHQADLDLELTLLGDGPERVPLEALAEELGIEMHCRFLGFVPRPWLELRDVDVVVFPSRFEGHSVSVLEAMARSHLVVASSITGIVESLACPELLYHPAESDHSLASRLQHVASLSDAERDSYRRQNLKRSSEFSEAAMADAYLGVIGDLLPERPWERA